MPRVRRTGLTLTLLLLLTVAFPSALPLTADASSNTVQRLQIGERLSYALSWGKISAGTAVLEVVGRETLSGRQVLQLLHSARTNDFVSFFYPVNNRVESFIDEQALPARLLFQRREGKKKNDIEVLFDQAAHLAVVTTDGVRETIAVPAGVQDTLSCIYAFRSLPLSAVGQSVRIDVYHDKKTYQLELRVEGYERMQTTLGEVETIRVLAIMPFRGLFLNEGNIRVWFTNDSSRIPVLMRAKVIIGSISATLTSSVGNVPSVKPAPP
jgi:Protein of unknown function (DUF3108)